MPNTDSLRLCKKIKMQQQEALMSLWHLKCYHRNPIRVSCDRFTEEKDGWSRTNSLLSACLVKGVRYTFSAAYLPPPTLSRGLESWRRCQPSHRISCWQRLVQQKKTKRDETTENNCTYHWGLKCCTTHLPCQTKAMGLREIPLLISQVCPDIFLPPKRRYVTQNTICCVHSSICQELNWRENCCDIVNSCLRSKQQTRHDGRFNATCELIHKL